MAKPTVTPHTFGTVDLIWSKPKAVDNETVLKEVKPLVTSVSDIYKLVDEISDFAA